MNVLSYFFVIFFVSAESGSLFDFVQDYVSEEFFWTGIYNTIDCSNEVSWIRVVSSVPHGSIAVHTTEESLENWVNSAESQTFFLNVNCPCADSILKQGNASNLFRSPFRWLLVDDTIFEDLENSTSWTLESKWYWKILKDLQVLLDSEVRMTIRGENGMVSIISAYKTSMESEVIKEELGIWKPEEGIVLGTRECKTIRRWNVRGARLLGSFVVTNRETLNHLEDMVDKHIDPISKVGYIVMMHLSEMINASIEMKIQNTWGVNVNGTWTGMIGDLQSGAVEIGISPAFVLSERMDVVNYYEMITPTRAKFIFLSPPLSFSNNIFTMPFDRMVWIASLIMVLVSCVLLYFAAKVEKEREDACNADGRGRTINLERYQGLRYSLGDILMVNVGAICMQGAVVEPKGASGRIITLFLYFSYMFLYVSYSGSIVALLQSSDTSIRTFKDLLESPLAVAADDVVYSQYYFKTESEPIRKALYKKKVAPKGEKPHFVPSEKGIENLRKGLYAFHVETSVGYSLIQKTFTEEEKCGLQEFSLSFFQTVDPLLTMKIHTPFTEYMRIGLTLGYRNHRMIFPVCRTKKIIETGLNHRALSRIYTKKPICSAKGSRFVSVRLVDCYHAFMILTYGAILAWLLFFVEKLCFWRIKRINKRRENNYFE